MKLRREAWEALIEEYKNPIDRKQPPATRLSKWMHRVEITKFAMDTIAVPYFRAMDTQNSMFGVGLKTLEQLYERGMMDGDDLAEIFAKPGSTNKEELMGGFESEVRFYILPWLRTFIDWSYNHTDVAPSYSITVHSLPGSNQGDPNKEVQDFGEDRSQPAPE